MKSFLKSVVTDLLGKEMNLKRTIIILPSQRACVFFKKELLQQLHEATFLPRIISVENYIQELADVQLVDTTQLLFEFYKVYSEIIPEEQKESFDTFSQWATIALSDFNEIDSYLVDANAFFTNLRDVKRLNEWFKDKSPSTIAVNYLQFFDRMGEMYSALYEQLKLNKHGYQGMVYREATENLEFYMQDFQADDQQIFVGFNALNRAEEYIIQELLQNKVADIYWDSNDDLFEGYNEAGTFLRKYKSAWNYFKNNPFKWIENNYDLTQIHVIGAPKNVIQMKYVGELLDSFEDYNNTALILSDEKMLSLTLNSLPDNANQINITMGFPLIEIPLAQLFERIFYLYLNQEKLQKKQEQLFYFKDVLSLLNDSFLMKVCGASVSTIITRITNENSIFLSVTDLEEMLEAHERSKFQFLFELFRLPDTVNDIIAHCSKLIRDFENITNSVEIEYLYNFQRIFQQLEYLNKTYGYIKNLKTLFQFYRQLLRNEKLSFRGEPLQGLQIMGMLESRAIDFDRVIITSVNEGILPANKNISSFIPFDMKKFFGMPTFQEKDAIFSYHFQRILKRAKEVYLCYNTETDGYGSGEKSRFITQLELRNRISSFKIVSPMLSQHKQKEPLVINKSAEIMQQLKELFTSGISPSAISTYIYNPISFYEKYILKIDDLEEVEETVASNTMGSVIHDVLEDLYRPFLGNIMRVGYYDIMNTQLDNQLNEKFRKHYFKGTLDSGKNKLIVAVCKTFIQNFLKEERVQVVNGAELKIISLEEKLNTEIRVDGLGFPVRFKGFVDRIDELNGVLRVIDYKTGFVAENQLKIADFSTIGEDYKYTKALQVMMYAYLYLTNTNVSQPVTGGIYSFKNAKNGLLKMNFSTKRGGADHLISNENLNAFLKALNTIILEILNPDIGFVEKADLPF